MLSLGDIEFRRNERHGNPGHENDEALEKFASCGKRPDTPLHRCHRHRLEGGSILPERSFVDIRLDGPAMSRRILYWRRRSADVHRGPFQNGRDQRRDWAAGKCFLKIFGPAGVKGLLFPEAGGHKGS